MREYTNGHYYSLNQYLRETFGCKVYKLALSGGYTCPNRDGSIAEGGCIFCSEGGSGDFAASAGLPVPEQIEQGRLRVRAKIKDGLYIAYFQSFTTTYMPLCRLSKLIDDAMSCRDVAAVSLGTRPDCLPDDVVDLLARANERKPVWVELGLQTANERTARYIRRGYELPVYDAAAARLRAHGINTIAHVILGLPGETADDMLATVRRVGQTADGIKLQLLHVLRNTDLAADYAAGRFETLEMSEYIDIVCRCIEALPEDVVIHRLTGDGAKRDLIAPLWSGDKKRVLNALGSELDRRGIRQGRHHKALR